MGCAGKGGESRTPNEHSEHRSLFSLRLAAPSVRQRAEGLETKQARGSLRRRFFPLRRGAARSGLLSGAAKKAFQAPFTVGAPSAPGAATGDRKVFAPRCGLPGIGACSTR